MLVNKALVEASTNRAPLELIKRYRSARPKQPGVQDRAAAVQQQPNFLARIKSLSAEGGIPSHLDMERILGTNDLVDLNWFERGLLAARAVCRVVLREG